jgi:hypothetical protein
MQQNLSEPGGKSLLDKDDDDQDHRNDHHRDDPRFGSFLLGYDASDHQNLISLLESPF